MPRCGIHKNEKDSGLLADECSCMATYDVQVWMDNTNSQLSVGIIDENDTITLLFDPIVVFI